MARMFSRLLILAGLSLCGHALAQTPSTFLSGSSISSSAVNAQFGSKCDAAASSCTVTINGVTKTLSTWLSAAAAATGCPTDASACTVSVAGTTQALAAWFAGTPLVPPAKGTIGGTLTGTLNWTICPSGCTYASPLDAWNAARAIPHIAASANIFVGVAHGTYNMTDQFYTDDPGMGAVQFIGDTASPGSVVFNFTNIAGNNFSAFIIQAGGKLGRPGAPGLAGLTLRGTGARTGASTWASQSYGAGVHAIGSGASAFLAGSVVIDSFYYSALIEENASMIGDGATYLNAGDVNLLARFGGSIQCDNCIADTASDIGTDEYGGTSILGYNYLAEAGGTIIANGATGRRAQVACFASLNTGRMWAHDAMAQNCVGIGFRATENGVVEAVGSRSQSNNTGAYADTGGMVLLDRAEIVSNQYDGVQAGFGGLITGGGVNSHNNGTSGAGIGIRILAGGTGSFTNTRSLLTGNATSDINVDIGTACTSPTAPCNPPSRLIIN